MHRKNETVSMIASLYRRYYTVEQLERINRVTGQAFPVSGDLWLTEPHQPTHYKDTDSMRERKRQDKMKYSASYGKTAPERLR